NLTYTPSQDYVGRDLFNYQVSNGTLTSPAAGVSITVKHGLSINNISLTEGNSGTKAATFTVTLTPSSSDLDVVTFSYRTADGTAGLTPENAAVDVGEPVNLSLTWTHPVGWRKLNSVDLLLVDEDGEALAVRWHEAENSFSLFNPAADQFVRTAEAASPTRFE